MRGMTRRNFIGASGSAAGMALAASIHGKAHGDSGKIRLGIIGVGARGQQHLREGLWGSKDFEIVAVADCYRNRCRGARLAHCANVQETLPPIGQPMEEQVLNLGSIPGVARHLDFREMVSADRLEAVVIATPPHTPFPPCHRSRLGRPPPAV